MAALVGALLCASWLAFFHYLAQHGDLVAEDVDDRFFPAERLRALVGVILYAAAGVLGYPVAPFIGLAIFVALPFFYAVISRFPHGVFHRVPVRALVDLGLDEAGCGAAVASQLSRLVDNTWAGRPRWR
jgi:hypothetical protein